MTDTDVYDEVYALFERLADRYDELTDGQHVTVMEAFNCFADVAPPCSPDLVGEDTDSVARLLRRTAEGLTRLSERAPDGTTALLLSRAHALLVSSLAA
jgi:hypothetical protein